MPTSSFISICIVSDESIDGNEAEISLHERMKQEKKMKYIYSQVWKSKECYTLLFNPDSVFGAMG